MRRGNVSYIVAYIISNIIILGGHSFPNLNHFNPPSSWSYYYCYWYSACLVCCNNLNIPRFRTGANTFDNLPRWNLLGPLHRGQLQNTRTQNYPMSVKNDPTMHSRGINDFRRLLIQSLINSARLSDKNIKINKTYLTGFKNTNNFVDHVNMRQGPDSGINRDVVNNIMLNRRKLNSSNTLKIEIGNKMSIINPAKSGLPLSVTNFTQNIGRLTEQNYTENTTKPSVDVSSSTTHHVSPLPKLPIKNSNDDLVPLAVETIDSVQNPNKFDHSANTSSNNFHYGTDESLQANNPTEREILFGKFRSTLDTVERKFLLSAFTKLTAISPEDRKENGISFLQSGFFLHQLLMSSSIEIDKNVTLEVEECLGVKLSVAEKIEIMERTVAWLPKSSDVLKFRWSSRLVLRQRLNVSTAYGRGARAMQLKLSWLNGTETAADIAEDLNQKVLADSGGTMQDTFDEDEVSAGVCAAALAAVYVRATWRAAPTLLNDTLPFRDAPAAPERTSRFFRLNDLMGYAYLHEWDAEAIEISYATPGLTLLMLVPKEPSLRALVERAANTSLDSVLGVMQTVRLAVTLPLYTLRMTLLLPNKLQDMGIPSLLTNDTDCHSVKFSHAVQRLMFWAEAGRNAFKDDGIEWDPRPELEIVVDRPYLFFVRWQNITIMNGAFVL